jgi:hypothetical protein
MGNITLQNRQSLSRRVHVFGSANGRGAGVFRFGDAASDKAKIDTAFARVQYGNPQDRETITLINFIDWAALYASDAAFAKSAYPLLLRWHFEPESLPPTIDAWFQSHGITIPTPGVINSSINVPVVTTPGMTDAEYQAVIAKAKEEAARLAATASAKQAANASDSARIAAENELAKKNAEIAATPATPAVSTPKKNVLPWLLAVGAAYFVLKG